MAAILSVHLQPVKEGYALLFDVLQGQWCRVYMSLSMKDIRLSLSSSTTNRAAARPPLLLADIDAMYCSVSVADAPARHIPILGLRTVRGEIVLLRTAERRSLVDWMAALAKAHAGCLVLPVQEMAIFRQCFSPSLYAQLFRSDEDRIPQFNASSGEGTTTVTPAGGAGRRIASLSAGCPRRAPIRRAFGTILQVMPSHADPNANPSSGRIPTASNPSSRLQSRATSPVNQPQQQATAAPRKSSSPGTTATNGVATKLLKSHSPPQSLHRIEIARSKSRSQENEDGTALTAAAAGRNSRSRQPSPSPITPSCAALQTQKPATSNAVLLPPPKIKFLPSQVNGANSTVGTEAALKATQEAAELQAANQKIAKLQQELAEFAGRNLDLELDHANVSARVLELEAEGSLLKASLAEWRRKHASLEQQLEVQERDFKRRLDEEKQALMEALQAEVAGQLKALKAKWDEREQELLRAAGDLSQ
jgi:hypothetical protein